MHYILANPTLFWVEFSLHLAANPMRKIAQTADSCTSVLHVFCELLAVQVQVSFVRGARLFAISESLITAAKAAAAEATSRSNAHSRCSKATRSTMQPHGRQNFPPNAKGTNSNFVCSTLTFHVCYNIVGKAFKVRSALAVKSSRRWQTLHN